jgi:hypothetical protein
MVTLTLIQGVLNTFVIFLSRAIGYFVDRVVLKNNSDAPGIGYYVTHIALEILLASWPPSWSCTSRASASSAPTPAPPPWPGARK